MGLTRTILHSLVSCLISHHPLTNLMQNFLNLRRNKIVKTDIWPFDFWIIVSFGSPWDQWISINPYKARIKSLYILYVLQKCIWGPLGGFKQQDWESSGFTLYCSGFSFSYVEVFSNIQYTVYQNYRTFHFCKDNFIRCLKEKTDTETNRTNSVSPIVAIIKKKAPLWKT